MFKDLFWGGKQLSDKARLLQNIVLTSIPLGFALFYPNIGIILAYAGSISGLVSQYILPVLVHLKQIKTKI
jgi:hypothetical protein